MLCQIPLSNGEPCKQEAKFIVRYDTVGYTEKLFVCYAAIGKWLDKQELRSGTVTITPTGEKEEKQAEHDTAVGKQNHRAEQNNLLECEVKPEWRQAEQKYGPMNSAHEAYAVILQRLNDFWELSDFFRKCDRKEGHYQRQMRKELIQIAAMACRTIQDLKL